MTGLTWRPVREDDQLDPGDRVRLAHDVPPHLAFDEFEVITALLSWVTIRPFGCDCDDPAAWENVDRTDLEVPR